MRELSPLFQRFVLTYQKNDVTFEEGAKGKETCVIHQGGVRILCETEEG